MALNGLFCADVPLRNSLTHPTVKAYFHYTATRGVLLWVVMSTIAGSVSLAAQHNAQPCSGNAL